jgi:hypothetical protein
MASGTIDHQLRPAHRSALAVAIAVLVIITTVTHFCWSEEKNPGAVTSPTAKEAKKPADYGFARADQNLFLPIILLAPPGPSRAARALAIFQRQLAFQRKISFHPELSPDLQQVLDLVPPRQSTLIRAVALYSQENIPWISLKDGTHEICVNGGPRTTDYYYALARSCSSPEEAERFSGVLAIKPAPGTENGDFSSVVGELGGELLMDTYGGGEFVDTLAGIIRETRGDLIAPWDFMPGQFNHHDRAALDRFKRDMPQFSARLEHYVDFRNVVDEFDPPSGPYVLFNMDATINETALKPFPHFYEFYRKVVPAVTASTAITDSHGNYWMRESFDQGHFRIIFMVRNGMLTPFNDLLAPAGDGVALDTIARGTYRTLASVHIRGLSLTFGLDNLSFITDYARDDQSMTLINRMDAIPELVAPVGIHQVIDLVAGEFMRTLAQGSGGLSTSISTRRLAADQIAFKGLFHGEYHYSPTLEFLARIGDSIAEKHNDVVRTEERRLAEDLFDAFVADYNTARPMILDGGEGSK